MDRQIGMEPFVIDMTKDKAKMARIVRNIFMFIANNSIFKSIINNFFNQVNSAERVLPDDKFWEKFILLFLKIRKNTNLMVKPLQNVSF